MKKVWLLIFVMCFERAQAQQFLTDILDSTTSNGRINFTLFGDRDRLKLGGYMQPQFQWASDKGIKSYQGGNFNDGVNNRFMLRRGRVRFDYSHHNTQGDIQSYFVFQFDGTERGVNIRDLWGRLYITPGKFLHVTMGMFARPMGFEILYSSSDREAPERGRMSQILMRTERDLGVMVTAEQRTKKKEWFRRVKFDLGVFNGQGLAGPFEYDSRKDIITRLSIKPVKMMNGKMEMAGGVATLQGGIVSKSDVLYRLQGSGLQASFHKDSATNNNGYVSPRKYYDADVQWKWYHKIGFTELRLEYMTGWQTSTVTTSETPGTYPTVNNVAQPLYSRPFRGAYVMFLHHLFHKNLQLLVKYDLYDPNTAVQGKEVNATAGFTAADVQFQTIGGGFMYHFNPHVKLTAFYDHPMNESTSITGYTKDIKDDVFTLRVQYRF